MNVPMIMEQNNQRVLTTAQLAEAYGTDENTIRQNFKRNKERFIEGKHFYALSGEELKKFVSDNLSLSKSAKVRKMYIWTENGALLHAKSLNTDKAWEVYEFLVDSYFRAKAETKPAELDYSGLSPQLQFMIQMEKRQNQLEARQDKLEERFEKGEQEAYQTGLQNARTLTSLEQNYFKRIVRVKAEILFKTQSGCLVELSLRQVQTGLYHALNRTFEVKSVSEIKRSILNEAVEFVKSCEFSDIL